MERLTSRCDGRPELAQGLKERFTEQTLFFMLLNRLAAYDDALLEPEEVTELVSPKGVTWIYSICRSFLNLPLNTPRRPMTR